MGNSQYSQLVNYENNILVINSEHYNDEYIITDITNTRYYSEVSLTIGAVYNIKYVETMANDIFLRTISEFEISSQGFVENPLLSKNYYNADIDYYTSKTTLGRKFINVKDKKWFPDIGVKYDKIFIYKDPVRIGSHLYYSVISIINIKTETSVFISTSKNSSQYIVCDINKKVFNSDKHIKLHTLYDIEYEENIIDKKNITRKITNFTPSPTVTKYVKFTKIRTSKKYSYNLLESTDASKYVYLKNCKWEPEPNIIYELKVYNNNNWYRKYFAIESVVPT